MSNGSSNTPEITLALPSKGSLADGTFALFKRSNLAVKRPNDKTYEAKISALPSLRVLLQRASEIPRRLLDGTAHIGVTGLDILEEEFPDSGLEVILPDLRFGQARLVFGVPVTWLAIRSMADLAALAEERRQQGRPLRIATKFHRLAERHLLANGIRYFETVDSAGTTELEPNIGGADLIVDLTSSGMALKENRLKELEGGTIYSSNACLVLNAAALQSEEQKQVARRIVRTLEATLVAEAKGGLYQIAAYCFPDATAKLQAALQEFDPEEVRFYIDELRDRGGEKCAKLEVVCRQPSLGEVVNLLQESGQEVLVTKTDFRFSKDAPAMQRLNELLG